MEIWRFDKKQGILYDIELLEKKISKTKRKDLRAKYEADIKRLRQL